MRSIRICKRYFRKGENRPKLHRKNAKERRKQLNQARKASRPFSRSRASRSLFDEGRRTSPVGHAGDSSTCATGARIQSPAVLPSVATPIAGQRRSACILRTANSAASELTGISVEARKLAPKSEARLAQVPIKPLLRRPRAGMRL